MTEKIERKKTSNNHRSRKFYTHRFFVLQLKKKTNSSNDKLLMRNE